MEKQELSNNNKNSRLGFCTLYNIFAQTLVLNFLPKKIVELKIFNPDFKETILFLLMFLTSISISTLKFTILTLY